jgi:hypothetical protein
LIGPLPGVAVGPLEDAELLGRKQPAVLRHGRRNRRDGERERRCSEAAGHGLPF